MVDVGTGVDTLTSTEHLASRTTRTCAFHTNFRLFAPLATCTAVGVGSGQIHTCTATERFACFTSWFASSTFANFIVLTDRTALSAVFGVFLKVHTAVVTGGQAALAFVLTNALHTNLIGFTSRATLATVFGVRFKVNTSTGAFGESGFTGCFTFARLADFASFTSHATFSTVAAVGLQVSAAS